MSINPFEAFNVGQQIGATNSPASGIGSVIRNVLQQAQKTGLINAQSVAQGAQAESLAQFKAGLEPETVPVAYIDTDGKLVEAGTTQKGTKIARLPEQESALEKQIKERMAGNTAPVASTPRRSPIGSRTTTNVPEVTDQQTIELMKVLNELNQNPNL